jgi:hypothetical protein
VTKSVVLPNSRSVSVTPSSTACSTAPISQHGNFKYAPATYNQPIGYLGGIRIDDHHPDFLQVQFGAGSRSRRTPIG